MINLLFRFCFGKWAPGELKEEEPNGFGIKQPGLPLELHN